MGGIFHEIVSGAIESFLEKYGDLEERINLCKLKVSPMVTT